MLFGKASQVKSRDEKYPALEASKLYVNSRTWRCESEKGSGDGDRLPGINSLGGHRPDPPTTEHLPSDTFWLHNLLQTTGYSTDLDSTSQFLTSSLFNIITSPKWAGILGLPAIQTRTQPPTAAVLPRTERVARAAGRAAIYSSPVLTRTISWTVLKMIRRRDRSARKRSRSLRRHVHKAGYVRLDLSLIACSELPVFGIFWLAVRYIYSFADC
jgi:hypothetical protein